MLEKCYLASGCSEPRPLYRFFKTIPGSPDPSPDRPRAAIRVPQLPNRPFRKSELHTRLTLPEQWNHIHRQHQSVHAGVLENGGEPMEGLPVYVACSGNSLSSDSGQVAVWGRSTAMTCRSAPAPMAALGEHPQALRNQAQDYSWLESYLDPVRQRLPTLLLPVRCSKSAATTPTPSGCARNTTANGPSFMPSGRVGQEGDGRNVHRVVLRWRLPEFLPARPRGRGSCISFRRPTRAAMSGSTRSSTRYLTGPGQATRSSAPKISISSARPVRSFRHWMISSDTEPAALASQHVATVQTSCCRSPCSMYSDGRTGIAWPPPASRSAIITGRPRTDEINRADSGHAHRAKVMTPSVPVPGLAAA